MSSGRFLTNHETGLLVGFDRRPIDMTEKVVVHNPFKEGDDIIIPAGTPYRVGWRGDKRMVSKRKNTVKVQQSYSASSDAAVGWLVIMQPTVTASYNEYQITPDIIEANGLEVRPGFGGDFLEGSFRGDRY